MDDRTGAGPRRPVDVVVFVTYLYATTYLGVPAVDPRTPLVLHPTAHDEPPIWYSMFDSVFRRADGLVFLTPEEQEFVERRFSGRPRACVLGHGTSAPENTADVSTFRRRYGLVGRPYIAFVGRLDPNKGAREIVDYFSTFKQRHPGPLALVLVGPVVSALQQHPDIVLTGFVDEGSKRAAMSGADLLVQPSYFESFSIVLVEAWLEGTAALVQGRSEVLRGQVERSAGGLAYEGYAQFEALLECLLTRPRLRQQMGQSGRRYALDTYGWPKLIDRYERFLREVPSGRVMSGVV
jgi:glycosyltransferase involved in cell wall biosynthesis